MNRKPNNGGDDSRNSKRRRWNGGGGGNSKKKDDEASRGGKDLAEKTSGRDDGYGYPSSDEETAIKTKSQQRRARKEQRMGMRSFRTAESSKNYDNDEEGTQMKAAYGSCLPTPRGWTQLSKKDAISSRVKTPRPHTDASKSSGFTLSSAPRANANQNKNNPYAHKLSAMTNKTPAAKSPSASSAPSTMRTSRTTKPRTTHHVVCAVSENLARETCVTSIDAGRPTYLHITKQGNGQTYAETMSLLRMLNPDEVLLNEGRRNSQLATKIMALFGQELTDMDTLVNGGKNMFGGKKNSKNANKNARGRKSSRFSNRGGGGDDVGDDLTTANLSSACETVTVVKFVPRSYFDQTKGAELLRKLARDDTYDASLVEEYILLSSSYAVLQYAQLCLGAGLTRGSLALDVNVGGNHRMNIDRATMVNLELLVNAKTGRTANSLVGTIDCTKTSVGGRLLRTNLMAPPTRLDTINARLDLVDSLLEDEEFFYVVMEHLEDLPDVDKMLSYVALAPKRLNNNSNGALFGNTERQTATARIASKGISALVCIKSTLSVIPSFAHVLEVQLKELDEREHISSGAGAAAAAAARRNQDENRQQRERSGRQDDDESTTVVESETSRNEDDSNTVDYSNMGGADNTTTTQDTSLKIGLGAKSMNNNTTRSMPFNKQNRHQLLRAVIIAMKQPALTRVLNAVSDIFTESTSYSKNSHAMRHQECFALKPNTDGMMDVLRKAFLANVDDIYRLADEYAETYDINVQVKETTSRGYYLSVSADLGLDLPQAFIQPVKNGRFIHCTTEEVFSLNSRAQENVQDLLLMTEVRIQDALQVARDNYDCIASLSDAIALLDMCHCFADNVASSRSSWCRPVLSDRDRSSQEDAFAGGGGAIAIRNGRYAIDVSSTGVSSSMNGGEFVPNDTYSSALQNFTVITGINGSGKSTYLKQIALIVILSHCGSYVPADEALLPIRDQICTRIGTADDQEHNISTFLLEMKETAFICNSTTDKSLFLLDELGRATSNEDGVAVAWSVSEYLLTKRAMTFFVTHYPQISKLAEVYPNVQNQHLGSQISSSSNGDTSSINYTHKIMPGPCKSAGDYGVEMTVTCGWPDDVVKNARKIREEVRRRMPGEDLCYNENSKQRNENVADNRRKSHNILADIAKHLAAMKEGEGRLSKEAKRNYLQELRDRIVPANDESLVRSIRNLLLNVDDAIPMIPRPAIDVSNAIGVPEKDTAAAEEEAMPSRMTKGLEDGQVNPAADATMTMGQWNCDFGSSSDDEEVSTKSQKGETSYSNPPSEAFEKGRANHQTRDPPSSGKEAAAKDVEHKVPVGNHLSQQKMPRAQENMYAKELDPPSKKKVMVQPTLENNSSAADINSVRRSSTSETSSASSSSSDDDSVSSDDSSSSSDSSSNSSSVSSSSSMSS